jgi:Uma2 family endonuclease
MDTHLRSVNDEELSLPVESLLPDREWQGWTEPRRRLWTAVEYYRMHETGLLPDGGTELIAGEVLTRHAGTPRRYRFSPEDYERMVAAGVLDPEERVELLDGEVLVMSPQRSFHASAVTMAYECLRGFVGGRYLVRCQMPLRLLRQSEPEPDVAVVAGTLAEYRHSHPQTAVLVVEASDTTLQYDQTWKASLYAAARIPEYWIVDLIHHSVQVRREPVEMQDQPFGFGYALTRVVQQSESIRPLSLEIDADVPVAELLPES